MKANDPDVVATSTVLSLQCPLSYTRLRTPCRSTLCGHIQCFDATSYLQLQEQGPQWICPVCNKPAPFENLAIDEYVKDILENTSDSLDQVTIEPNGQWKTHSVEPTPKKSTTSYAEASIDVDDDVSVITNNTGYNNRKTDTPYAYGTPSHYLMGHATPSSISREPSGTPKSKGKRTAAEVIDLTLSSDEDDEPLVRAPKRQNVGPSPGPSNYNSYSSFNHNGYHTTDPHY
jgi:E3 SUMO-protein ligase PIAS1